MAVDYSKLLDGNSLKAIRTYITTNFQPLNANLTSISSLATNVTGLIKMTNGVASLDGTIYAPLASPSFTGTPTLPTTTKIGTLTSTGLVKYTNGVLSIDTSTYLTSHLYRPVKVNGVQKLANTSSTAIDFGDYGISGQVGINFQWDSTHSCITAGVDLSDYITAEEIADSYQPLSDLLTSMDHDLSYPTSDGNYFIELGKSGNVISFDFISTFPTSAIPALDASKITSGTFADARIASASTWNAKYTKPSGGIPASDLAESYILTSAKGAASGVASLDANGKVPTSQLPESVTGGLEYKGTFNASTASSAPAGLEKGWYYVCSTAGSKNPDGTTASASYSIGDWAVYNGTSWDKIDNTDSVSSVCGKTGAVTLDYSDVGAAASSHSHGNILSGGTITSTVVTSATGVLVYDSSNKIQRATAAQTRTIIGAGTYSKPSGGIPASDLAETYLLATAKAADSDKLNGQSASYYLNYNNLTNKPTIPTQTSQLTNDGDGSSITRYVGLQSAPNGSGYGSTCILISGGASGWASGGAYLIHNSQGGYNNIILPNTDGTLALKSDIPTINCYTEQEALDILNGTAS